MALPITVMQQPEAGTYYDPKTVFQGAFIYDVDLENGFTLRGKGSHYGDGYWGIDNKAQRRWGITKATCNEFCLWETTGTRWHKMLSRLTPGVMLKK